MSDKQTMMTKKPVSLSSPDRAKNAGQGWPWLAWRLKHFFIYFYKYKYTVLVQYLYSTYTVLIQL